MGNWVQLTRHPTSPAGGVTAIEGIATRWAGSLGYRIRLYGETKWLELPELLHPSDRRRRDGLWQSTCVEAFARPAKGEKYAEFNLSAAGHWAAYHFERRREGARDLISEARVSSAYKDHSVFDIGAEFQTQELPDKESWAIGLAVVVESLDGAKSYWSLVHGDPEKPDFHDPACFVLELPATG